MEPLTKHETCVLIVSIALGMLDSAVKLRANNLGGWAEAKKKQGIIKITDPGIKVLQEAEETLFFAMDKTVKILSKATPKVATAKGFSISHLHEDIYIYAGMITDELQRLINVFDQGKNTDITYTDGYSRALDDIEKLMFKNKKNRTQALSELRDNLPQCRDIRETVNV